MASIFFSFWKKRPFSHLQNNPVLQKKGFTHKLSWGEAGSTFFAHRKWMQMFKVCLCMQFNKLLNSCTASLWLCLRRMSRSLYSETHLCDDNRLSVLLTCPLSTVPPPPPPPLPPSHLLCLYWCNSHITAVILSINQPATVSILKITSPPSPSLSLTLSFVLSLTMNSDSFTLLYFNQPSFSASLEFSFLSFTFLFFFFPIFDTLPAPFRTIFYENNMFDQKDSSPCATTNTGLHVIF